MGGEFGGMKAIIYNWFVCRRRLKLRVIPFHTNINQTWCCCSTAARRRVSSNWMVKYKNIRATLEQFEWSVIGRRRWELPNIFPLFYWRLPTLQGVQMSVPCLVVQLLRTIHPANVVHSQNRMFAFFIKSHTITQWTDNIIIEKNRRNKLHFYNFSNECHCWSRIILTCRDLFGSSRRHKGIRNFALWLRNSHWP
jgi:hypothetical protein